MRICQNSLFSDLFQFKEWCKLTIQVQGMQTSFLKYFINRGVSLLIVAGTRLPPQEPQPSVNSAEVNFHEIHGYYFLVVAPRSAQIRWKDGGLGVRRSAPAALGLALIVQEMRLKPPGLSLPPFFIWKVKYMLAGPESLSFLKPNVGHRLYLSF